MDEAVMDVLVRRERYKDMLALLTPKQIAVVALRLDGMNGEEIAALLGITRKAVHVRLCSAQLRILREYPELGGMVEGRSRQVGVRRWRAVAAESGGE